MKDIELTNVSKAYGELSVLENFTYTFKSGSRTCITGPSGRGKTTLLYIIAGLLRPDKGELNGLPERPAFVFQEDRLAEDFSALSNVRMVCGKKTGNDEIIRHLRLLGLEGSEYKPCRELSGGMKRRVAIARAMCCDSDCILLDEAFSGLDPDMKKNAMDYVLRYSEGKTLICVTHDSEEADYIGGFRLSMYL